MSDRWRKWCRELQNAGVLFDYIDPESRPYCSQWSWWVNNGKMEEYEIQEQSIPDVIKDWRTWVKKWQERGILFARDGNIFDDSDGNQELAQEKSQIKIPKQPIPEKFLQENTEMDENKSEEVTLKITVSDDVDSIRFVSCISGKGFHNLAGPAKYEYKKVNGEWVEDTRNYCVNSVWTTKEKFEQMLNPPKEYTLAQIEELLGHPVKIIEG